MITLHTMKETDLCEVAETEKQIFSQPWSKNGFLSSIQSPDTLYLVARMGGKLVGYCGLIQSMEEAEITNVAVEASSRCSGVGFRMLSELIRRGKIRGISSFFLEVREGNEAALHLYEKLGFRAIGIRKNFYEKPREHAVVMQFFSEISSGNQEAESLY